MMMHPEDRERWQQCQRTAQGLADDMETLLTHIDRLDNLHVGDLTELCQRVKRTNPHGTPEYDLALEASDMLSTLRYLREQTTLPQLLKNKLQFIMDLHRQQLMAIHPDADANDIEFELALDMHDLRTKGEEK